MPKAKTMHGTQFSILAILCSWNNFRKVFENLFPEITSNSGFIFIIMVIFIQLIAIDSIKIYWFDEKKNPSNLTICMIDQHGNETT